MEEMANNSQDLLRSTVLSIVSHNQSLDTILSEVSSMKDLEGGKSFIEKITELTCVPILKTELNVSRSLSDQNATDQCATKLISLVKTCKGQLFQKQQKEEVQSILYMLKKLMLDGAISQSRLCHKLCKQITFPVELVSTLHKEGVLSLEEFIRQSHQNKSDFPSLFTGQLVELCVDPDGADCFADVLAELVVLGFTEIKRHDMTSIRNIASTVVDRVVLEIVDVILQKRDKETLVIVSTKFGSLGVDLEVLKRAFTHILSLIMTHKPVLKVSQAIRQQAGWAYGKIPLALSELYKQILLPFEVTEILEILHRILEQQEVNWQLLLSFVSVTTVCIPESSKPLLDFTDRLLQEGLDNCDIETAITGMLLARQACFQGPHVFLSYADWFQRTFSDGSHSLTDTRKSFTFFIKFLTDLTPYESAQHIKVHILRPPFVPVKCRQLLSDYISLAKTRLEDLKECLETPGQDGNETDTLKAKDQTECEVNNAVSLFEATEKVATSVMEASIFRKPYYIGRFLPALLRPRPLPDMPDAKMKLITSLRKADKIPQGMYTCYEAACKKETRQLMEGVFLDVSSDDDDMELSALEQLEGSFNQLMSAVEVSCESGKSKPKYTVAEAISRVCEKVESLLSVSRTGSLDCLTPVCIDVKHMDIPSLYLQVVDTLLNSISRALRVSFVSARPQFTWLSLLLQALTDYPSLTEALCKRIWTLLMKQGLSLENHHIDSMAAVLVELQLLSNKVQQIQLLGTCEQCLSLNNNTLAELVMKHVSISNRAWMTFALRITSAYMNYIYCAHADREDLAIVPSAVKKFVYLAPRLLAELRLHSDPRMTLKEGADIVSALYQLDMFRNVQARYMFTMTNWVEYELSVNPNCDSFTDFQRQEYYSWVVYHHFFHKTRQDGGYGGKYKEAAALIMNGLLVLDRSLQDAQAACPKCASQGGQLNLSNTSRCYFISLLQELTRLFEISGNNHDNNALPWLPQLLVDVLSGVEDLTARQTLVHQFFRLCICLPSYLMFSDASCTLQSNYLHLEAMVNFINTIIVEFMCEGIGLPTSITVYLAQGMSLCCKTNIWNLLCEKCPVILVSILIHSETVHPFIQAVQDDETSVLGNIIGLKSKKMFPSIKEPWLCACAMFSQQSSLTYGDCPSPFHDLYNNLDSEQICAKYADILVLKLTYMQNFKEPKDIGLINRLQSTLNDLVSGKHGAVIVNQLFSEKVDERTKNCVNKSVSDLKMLTVLRYLVDQQPYSGLAETINGQCMTGLLRGYIAVGKQFDDVDSDSVTVQILPVYTSITRYVTTLILATPTSVLKSLDQDMVLECGPGVSDAVIQAIHSHG